MRHLLFNKFIKLCFLASKCQDGAEVLGLQCNIRSRESVKQMISDTISHFGRVDGLVNNGGGQFHSPAENISANGFHAVVETNLYGTYHCMMEAFEQHMKENGGKIVNIVTINRMGMAGMAHSGAARAGVKNLSMSLGKLNFNFFKYFSVFFLTFEIFFRS